MAPRTYFIVRFRPMPDSYWYLGSAHKTRKTAENAARALFAGSCHAAVDVVPAVPVQSAMHLQREGTIRWPDGETQ